jgi:exopolyphosphatase/guanosine-5'-triphosphate,3'-diphosphate pyrophosphatase
VVVVVVATAVVVVGGTVVVVVGGSGTAVVGTTDVVDAGSAGATVASPPEQPARASPRARRIERTDAAYRAGSRRPPTLATRMRVAVIDLGSNSFRLQLSEVTGDGAIAGIHQERRMLHLGAVVGTHGHLPDDAVRLAIGTARELADVAERVGCDRVFAVATSALREAANGPEVVDLISAAIGTPVRVVDGLTEARLSFLGAQAAVRLEPGPRLVADLGGGSLELAVGEGREVEWSTSHLLGVSRVHALVGGREVLDEADLERIDHLVGQELDPAVGRGIPPQAVAVGGAVRALADLVAGRRSTWVPGSINHISLDVEDLDEATRLMAPLDAEARVEDLGVRESRAADLPVAGAILSGTLRRLRIPSIVVSDWGLRAGAVYDGLDLPIPEGDEVWERSALGLLRRFLPDDDHPPHVAELVRQLWPQLEPLHDLHRDDLRVVVTAALLHDVGKSLALDGHHRHSAYLVEHAGLRGLDPPELASVLSLVRYHRGGPPRRSYPPYASLDKAHRHRTRTMAAVLQLADALDRSRDGSVQRVVVGDDGTSLIIRLLGEAPLPPEGGSADARLAYVSDTLGRSIEFAT